MQTIKFINAVEREIRKNSNRTVSEILNCLNASDRMRHAVLDKAKQMSVELNSEKMRKIKNDKFGIIW